MRYLFSGKASVKHLTTTDDTGSPRLLKEHKQEKQTRKEKTRSHLFLKNTQILAEFYSYHPKISHLFGFSQIPSTR